MALISKLLLGDFIFRIIHVILGVYTHLLHQGVWYPQINPFNLRIFFNHSIRYLHNNKITHLSTGLFENMVSLKRLRLDNNEIVCDCNILWLLKLLKTSTHIETDITCKYPENLNGKSLSHVNESELDCSEYLDEFILYECSVNDFPLRTTENNRGTK